MKMSGDLQPYVFIYLLSFGLLLHIKKKKRKQKNKKNKTKNKKKNQTAKQNKMARGATTAQPITANYSGPLRDNCVVYADRNKLFWVVF